MPHLVVAPDKFRGTATALEVAAAVGRAARQAGWDADEIPLADGGEGTLEAVGGEPRHAVVRGPLGQPVTAEWRFLRAGSTAALALARATPRHSAAGAVAVVEAARAAGRALLPRPSDGDPVRAGTEGVGELVLAAVDAGAERVIVGAGGSATTDGGWGAVSVIGTRERLRSARLVVACDVDVPFLAAPALFGPQKGATPADVAVLERRLERLAAHYLDRFGVEIRGLPGGGAAGGLAGGLAALGADLVRGFDLLAALVGLRRRIEGADLVVTGEGRLDATSFAGKVVGGVIDAAGDVPVLCVAGDVDEAIERGGLPVDRTVEVVSLRKAVGARPGWEATAAAVAHVVGARLATWGPR